MAAPSISLLPMDLQVSLCSLARSYHSHGPETLPCCAVCREHPRKRQSCLQVRWLRWMRLLGRKVLGGPRVALCICSYMHRHIIYMEREGTPNEVLSVPTLIITLCKTSPGLPSRDKRWTVVC